MAEQRASVTVYFDHTLGREIIRANVWNENGHSSKTCYSPSEAQSFITAAKNKKPMARPDQSYRNRPGPWND